MAPHAKGSAVHEFGVASEIWEAVRRAAGEHGGGRIRAITVEIGELNLIEDEQLRFWVTALAERDGSPGAELRIAHLPVTVRCRQCGETRTAESRDSRVESRETEVESRFLGGMLGTPAAACPRCGSGEVEVIGGREIRVVSAEVDAGQES